ncbi:MAG: sigma-54-dependent Fis family transcriptional regulator [Deltaproteobacteria bacterium]|nr:sigma-54-dependent Fis family transcriptional regulator [Deltaproteobacteria bacterium]
MSRKKVLLVENDTSDQSNMSKILVESRHNVTTAGDGMSAFQEIVRDHYDLVITELDLPRMNGLDLLRRIKKINKCLPVIITSANARVQEAVEAMKLGASDFLVKPLTLKMIEIITSRISNDLTETDKGKSNGKFTIITKNREMDRLLQQAREIADSQASVFIQGESGTGKELFARYIHHYSTRRDKSFVAINCAALPETLLESELFGHEKGSFTGALTRKKGKFEIANHGTLLLDEISEMDYHLQSKLLRVLQEREIDRVGGTVPIPVNFRVIATTNRDIEKQIKDGKFREDLYYRLNVIPFLLPPLRERIDDIPLLANYFIEKYNRIDKRSVKGLTEEAITSLLQMSWKGNVREFENIIERAILMCEGDMVDEDDLFVTEKNRRTENAGYPFMPVVSLKEMEKTSIFRALDHTNDNRTHAAKILGISVRTLRNKLNEYREKMETQ